MLSIPDEIVSLIIAAKLAGTRRQSDKRRRSHNALEERRNRFGGKR